MPTAGSEIPRSCIKGATSSTPSRTASISYPRKTASFCINEFIKNLIAVEKGEIALPTNFAEWITYTFGRGIAECYMVPYNEKIWNYPVDRMSHHWVEGRIPRPPVEDIVKSAIGIETEGYVHQAVFSYPVEGGIEALVRGIAEPVLPAIRTGFAVASIREDNGGFAISDGGETVHADRLISTIPLQNLLPCLQDVRLRCRQPATLSATTRSARSSSGLQGKSLIYRGSTSRMRRRVSSTGSRSLELQQRGRPAGSLLDPRRDHPITMGMRSPGCLMPR